MHRFFVDENSISGNIAKLSVSDSLHAYKVLRLGAGDKICVCDSVGFDYDGIINAASKDCVTVELSDKRPSGTEPDIKISLIQCLPKTGKMEVIIQKCVELGVCDFYPVESERCVVRPEPRSASAKIERYNKVAYEAAKQAVRGIIPCVHDFSRLKDHDFSQYDVVIIPYEEERELTMRAFAESCGALAKKGVRVAIIIGPEGGFEKSEVADITEKGGTAVTLGKRILRTETAGMAAVAMLMGILEA